MSLIDVATLADLRYLAESVMESTVRFQTAARTTTPAGTVAKVWTTAITTPCGCFPAPGRREERLRSAQLWEHGDWRLLVPLDTDVQMDMRAIVDGTNPLTNETWRKVLSVTGIAGPHDFEVGRVVGCDQIDMEPGEVLP